MYLKSILCVALCMMIHLHAGSFDTCKQLEEQEPVLFVMYHDFPGASSPVVVAPNNTSLLYLLNRGSPKRQDPVGRQSPNRPSSPVCGRRK
jgi:hypothetical protein